MKTAFVIFLAVLLIGSMDVMPGAQAAKVRIKNVMIFWQKLIFSLLTGETSILFVPSVVELTGYVSSNPKIVNDQKIASVKNLLVVDNNFISQKTVTRYFKHVHFCEYILSIFKNLFLQENSGQ